MGLFGSKKTYVSSTIYNMAGSIENRPNFLKTLMVGRALGVNTGSLGEQLQTAYLNGPGIKLRSYGRWSENDYPIVGVPRANLYSRVDVPSDKVAKYIPSQTGSTVNILRVETKLGDYAFWAEQWMLANRPGTLPTDWVSDYDEANNKIRITFADGSYTEFVPNDFRKTSAYIFAVYTEVSGEEPGPIQEGEEKILAEGDPYPSVSGWDKTQTVETPTTVQLQTIVQTTKSYSDGRPDEVDTKTSIKDQTYTYLDNRYVRSTYDGAEPGTGVVKSTKRYRAIMAQGTVDDREKTETSEQVVDGVTITTKVKTTEEFLAIKRSYKDDQQVIVLQTTSNPQLWIYRFGSGNAELDGLVNEAQDDGFYFPFIPLRLDNKFTEQVNPEAWTYAKKAYKKATRGNLDDIIKNLEDNESLKDMDYVYIMFGVSLNTKEMVGKKYLYGFFDKLRLSQDTTSQDYQLWRAQQQAFLQGDAQMIAWQQAQSDPSNPLFGTDPPSLGSVSAIPTNEIRIRGNGTLNTNLDIQISWQNISRQTGTGLGRPGAKEGDYWLDNGTTDAYAQSLLVQGNVLPISNQATDRLVIHHQIDDMKWETLTIIGLTHKNFIYNGKFVEIKSKEAMEDKEESGFLVPLHYQTFRDLGIKDSTQLSTACCYLVVNSYLVKKTGFFSSFFFKILLVVAVVAVTVATGGIGGASAGLLGTNAAVGAAIGLAGTAAVIVGAVANAVAAMILTKLITMGATAAFGDKLGAIIGAIASVVALQVGTGLMNNQSLSSIFQGLTKADSIINLTNAAGQGVSGYIRGAAMETMQQTQDLIEDYEKQSSEIADKFAQEFGYGRAMLDPLAVAQRDDIVIEPSSTFLERTLMTGSDVAELTTNLISRFTAITLSTELP